MQMVLTTNSRMIRGYAIIVKGDEPIEVRHDELKSTRKVEKDIIW
ncbi:MAG: hypothetical protein APG08_00883 [Candidatus Methanofastidiosum methylothiophilum]|jgi:hypothetical protein|uniref:Uncharacterized protein n=1 Tax=Candidatus Methanofastidiosum methylothiophilum TaxID=1705564 RepID=A0A150JLC8_9EURY|nr:MAG: hypothetical protein AN188_00689 [Candidatus Methanofastidiosum methylthiophilus]KYC56555.1 MAG: hypothetical protein APG08_00883 [Candidatus Methanofastidiosum methylthiophilus]KYC58059.1 MAG: hypothetical protein APG09_00559 [Candidatus Methanofastidiosum methylthiophilus]